MSEGGEPSGEVAADVARADDADLHDVSPGVLFCDARHNRVAGGSISARGTGPPNSATGRVADVTRSVPGPSPGVRRLLGASPRPMPGGERRDGRTEQPQQTPNRQMSDLLV
ncbi:hypothetical protein GCM10010405_13150 [Streptomyces macrosporus]|uniref:Uncharacterized protein n=1 Tax=Streptomyces macrosporus TaxID=44032 RepID=A0ABN3JIV9_9ACTN